MCECEVLTRQKQVHARQYTHNRSQGENTNGWQGHEKSGPLLGQAAAVQHQAEREGDGQRTTRKRAMDPGSYSEARAYKQRATQEEMSQRRLRTRQRRLGPTANSTEIGKRQRDEMSEIAKKCARWQHRERYGDG